MKRLSIIYQYSLLILLLPVKVLAQSVDLESAGDQVKSSIKEIASGKAFKVNGGISANSVYYNSNQDFAGREPLTYFLQGNLNFSFLSWTMPLSYSYTNQGSNLGYDVPFKFNRLALNPRYKWVQGYIGDATMSFSPYTLNGHLFTGGGVELIPQDFPLKVSAMYGRLLKAVEDNGQANTIPSFNRMGGGLKLLWEKDSYSLGIIGFHASDDINSLDSVPDAKGITPQENLVLSVQGKVKLWRSLELFAEYASSALTVDTRANTEANPDFGLAALFFNNTSGTQHTSAIKTGMNITLQATTIGVQYERVDPEYRTLGAYFFNNDFENITLNIGQQFFKGKLSVNANTGYQRDNLNNQKTTETGRFVGAVDINAQLSEKLSIQTNVSNFTSYTNMRLNQFTDINDLTDLDNGLDTLDYKQITKNAALNINYTLRSDKQQNQSISLNYNVNDVANKQGDIVRTGDGSILHNSALVHTVSWEHSSISLTSTLNYTHNTIGFDEASMYGASVSASKSLLDGELNFNLGLAANIDNSNRGYTQIGNIRFSGTWSFWEKHNLLLTAVHMQRDSDIQDTYALKDISLTLGYNYSF